MGLPLTSVGLARSFKKETFVSSNDLSQSPRKSSAKVCLKILKLQDVELEWFTSQIGMIETKVTGLVELVNR